MSQDWTAAIAGERMRVDNAFSETIDQSSFSNQQWGLIMTAVSFEIESPSSPDEATLVPDTSKVSAIIPELEKIETQGMAGGGGARRKSGSGSGLLDSIGSALGLGGSAQNDEQDEEINELTNAYCEQLQEELESNGRWEDVCSLASEESE